jgi:hypothetical protein
MVKIKASMVVDGNDVALEILEVESDRKSIKTVSNLLFDILFEKEDNEKENPEAPEIMYR